MGMVVDMLLTVAIVAAASAAITEFQIRVRNIGLSADGTFMAVSGSIHHFLRSGSPGRRRTVTVGLGPIGSLLGVGAVSKIEFPFSDTVSAGQYIDAASAEEDEVVQQGK